MLTVYKYYKKYINGNKWNYHNDNIWNLLIRHFSKKIKIFNKYIYIYKRNNESLNMNKGNIIDIKNRIYRLKLLINLHQKLKNNLYYYNLYFYLDDIISICNASFLSNEKEIKKGISKISIDLLNTFKNEKQISKNIIYILNKISSNKIILLYHKNNQTSINYKLSLFKFLKENSNKIIIPIDINNNTQINNIINYIYLNDIIVGIVNIIYLKKFKMIINPFYNYKIIIFNLDKTIKRSLINSSNIIFFEM